MASADQSTCFLMKPRFHLLLRFLSSLGFLKPQPELVFVTIALLSASWWLSLLSSMRISPSSLRFSYPVHAFILRHLKSVMEVGRVQSLNKMAPPVLVSWSHGTSYGVSLPQSLWTSLSFRFVRARLPGQGLSRAFGVRVCS